MTRLWSWVVVQLICKAAIIRVCKHACFSWRPLTSLGGVCVRNERCASPASVHKVAGKSEDAQKAVVLWFDSPASLSGSCQKQAAVSEQGPIALPDFNLIRCVWKKHTVCVWGGCHYDKAKPATARKLFIALLFTQMKVWGRPGLFTSSQKQVRSQSTGGQSQRSSHNHIRASEIWTMHSFGILLYFRSLLLFSCRTISGRSIQNELKQAIC